MFSIISVAFEYRDEYAFMFSIHYAWQTLYVFDMLKSKIVFRLSDKEASYFYSEHT